VVVDGVFIEAWMRKARKAGLRNKTGVFGGWYNHSGKKKGFGIVVSIIVDWCGFVPVPITVEIYPANENDNIVFRDTFTMSLDGNPKPAIFIDTAGDFFYRHSLESLRDCSGFPFSFTTKTTRAQGTWNISDLSLVNAFSQMLDNHGYFAGSRARNALATPLSGMSKISCSY
jgi:hypothetical protein